MTPEIREAYASLERSYENRCQMIWDDMTFEFQIRYGLSDEEMLNLE